MTRPKTPKICLYSEMFIDNLYTFDGWIADRRWAARLSVVADGEAIAERGTLGVRKGMVPERVRPRNRLNQRSLPTRKYRATGALQLSGNHEAIAIYRSGRHVLGLDARLVASLGMGVEVWGGSRSDPVWNAPTFGRATVVLLPILIATNEG
jgi:hypothetical protein